MSKFERMNKSDFINYIVERHSPNVTNLRRH